MNTNIRLLITFMCLFIVLNSSLLSSLVSFTANFQYLAENDASVDGFVSSVDKSSVIVLMEQCIAELYKSIGIYSFIIILHLGIEYHLF